MAVTIRLARYGVPKKPFYRIVATDKQKKRNGRSLDVVGTFAPMLNPPAITLKEERVRYWVGQGAQVTDVVRRLVMKTIPGLLEEREKHKTDKIRAQRKKRKDRLKKGAKAAKKK